MAVKCFFLEPTNRFARSLRRYSRGDNNICPVNCYHNASIPIESGVDGIDEHAKSDSWSHDDSRWPKQCSCGYVFTEQDVWQLFTATIYKRVDTGEEYTLRDAPDGAMWYADWILHGRLPDDPNRCYMGPDGHSLVVKVVGGHDWMVDGRASNCTMPDDDVHKCWCRYGDPRTGNITVDKSCNTCNAGGGSILTDKWHGFLRDGMFVE